MYELGLKQERALETTFATLMGDYTFLWTALMRHLRSVN